MPKINKKFTINRVETEGEIWDFLVNVLVLLFSGINLLLFFLFTSVEITGQVDVGVFVEFGHEVFFIKDGTLTD